MVEAQEKERKPLTGQRVAISNHVDFDDILPYAGEFGLYQLFLFLSTLPFYFCGVFVYFGQMFMTEIPDHWCWIPELQNLTIEERKSLAIPHHVIGYAKCKSYVANWSEVLGNGVVPNSNWKTQTCTNGWEYNLTEIPYPTISTELNWVCDQDTNQALAQTIFFAGTIFGCVIFGVVADKFGRLPAIVGSCLMGCVGGVSSTFSKTFVQFSVCRFITGMAYDSCMMIEYLLILEFIVPKYRTLILNLSFALFYTLAAVSLPWIALACNHWKTLTLVTSVPFIIGVLFPILLPESPRWLLSKRRVGDAVKILMQISRINKKDIPADVLSQFKSSYERQEDIIKSENAIHILKRPLLRKMIILISLEYFCCNLIFDSLMRCLEVLDFSLFISFSVVAATDFPSLFILAFILDIMGRRWLVALTLLACCVSSFITYFAHGGASVICIFFARFFINMGYNTCFQWAAEMLPTPVRGTYTSAIHTIGFVATMISPHVAYLDRYSPGLPFIAIALFGLVGGICALCLPETAKKDMPDTISDAESLIKCQRCWEFPWKRVG